VELREIDPRDTKISELLSVDQDILNSEISVIIAE